MEIDLISIVIGILALSTFAVPIGLYQYSEKRKFKNARNRFKSAADRNGFHIDEFEVFRGGIVIGIDYQNQVLLHLVNSDETVLKFADILNYRLYKTQHKEVTENDSITTILEAGIAISLRNIKHSDLRLPIIKWKEENTFYDENLIAQRWINKIRSVQKPIKSAA